LVHGFSYITFIFHETPFSYTFQAFCPVLRFSTWTASKRLLVRFPHGEAITSISAFFSLLDAYENDFFPIHLHLTHRYLSIWLKRWREFVELGHLIVKYKILKKAFRPSELFPIRAATIHNQSN
jgi:hypothetical protein